jgi:hypothetical protein
MGEIRMVGRQRENAREGKVVESDFVIGIGHDPLLFRNPA